MLRPVAQSAERRGIGVEPWASASCPGCEPFRSLVVTELDILEAFPFRKVMERVACPPDLCDQSEAPSRALALFRQWWDTQNASGPGPGPKCTPPLFDFPYQCPRVSEGNEATGNPFQEGALGEYVPIGLFNRIDLADKDGLDCGEYRIVYARRSGFTQERERLLINFEAVLPNPTPSAGLPGCQPIAKFWHSLSTPDLVPAVRAKMLHDFYLSGPNPAVHVDNYGARPCASDANRCRTGQIRTNQFLQSPWVLREFRTKRDPSAVAFGVQIAPATVKDNPFGGFFTARQLATAPDFRAAFLDSVSTLARGGMNDLCHGLAGKCGHAPDKFNAAESPMHDTANQNDYAVQFQATDAEFAREIEARLAGTSVTTAAQLINRVQALSCAGCHHLSNNEPDLGGFTWPKKHPDFFKFVHVSEQRILGPPEARFYGTSEALAEFLPHRLDRLGYVLSLNPP